MVRPNRRTVPALIAALTLSLFTIVPAAATNTPQGLPFEEHWSDITRIDAANWNLVPGIEGYFGRELTGANDVDPQTVLTAAASPEVLANQTLVASTSGGVAEFEIADPVIALQGSGTADAPYVQLHMNTTGLGSITVAYDLRDIDSTADNAAQQVALQYRVGSSGNC